VTLFAWGYFASKEVRNAPGTTTSLLLFLVSFVVVDESGLDVFELASPHDTSTAATPVASIQFLTCIIIPFSLQLP
jgi:hypothetical protein